MFNRAGHAQALLHAVDALPGIAAEALPGLYLEVSSRPNERLKKDSLDSSDLELLRSHLETENRMNAEARTASFKSADWLTAAQVSEMAGFQGQNPSTQPNKWKRQGRIFAVNRNGTDYYPSYALNAERSYRPVKGLEPILELFKGEMDDWEIAVWFASLNSFLGGKMPKELLQRSPERVLAAAQDEMTGVQHG